MVNQPEMFQDLINKTEKLSEYEAKYWSFYSHPGTWEFWLMVVLLVAPLVVLYFMIDRKRILLMGFYGFNIHAWFGYIDSSGARVGWWGYPYHIFPYLSNFALDASLIPVSYILVYQWTIKHKKNYYLYTFLLSAFFAFILKPILRHLGLFVLEDGIRYVDLFIGYCIVFIASKTITSLFLFLGNKEENVF